MNVIRLLIAECDFEYGTALGKVLANNYPIFQVEIVNGSAARELPKFLEDAGEKYNLILVSGDWKEDISDSKEDSPAVIGLCDTEGPLSKCEGYLFKYAGVAEISAALQIIYGQLSGKRQFNYTDLNTEIIGFTGACGGVGKTSLAIATARELASFHNSKVLYLSMEEIESTEIYLSGVGGTGNLSDYLYYLFSEREQHIATYPDGFLFVDEWGVECFHPSNGMNESKWLSEEKLSHLLKTLCNSRNYHYICLDFDVHISQSLLYLLKSCQKILLIDDGRPLSIYKNQRFKTVLHTLYGEDLESRMIPVRNKWNGEVREEILPAEYYLDYDEESFQIRGNRIEINIHNGFGMGVKKIAEEIRGKI
ncbi:MAG: hypothetical protein PHR60_02035 [Eubacteriales bacterium]|nr:hypothetical protein [Eubacteriales bacterium]MDD4582950.1 hypothetical protein [Eubacteriales bacterium]